MVFAIWVRVGPLQTGGQQQGNGIRFSAISYAKNEVLDNANNLLTACIGIGIQIEIEVDMGMGVRGHKHVIKALLAILTLQSSAARGKTGLQGCNSNKY